MQQPNYGLMEEATWAIETYLAPGDEETTRRNDEKKRREETTRRNDEMAS
jgi:hypothetical protein